MNWAEIGTTIDRCIDGVASPEEFAALSCELEANADARSLHLRLAWLNATLATRMEYAADQPNDVRGAAPLYLAPEQLVKTPLPARAVMLLFRNRRLAAVGVGMIGIALLVRHAPWIIRRGPSEIGVVTGAASAHPSGAKKGWRVGQPIHRGWCSLETGALELTLNNGVRMTFEGPGEIEIFSPMRASMHAGRVVVRVPHEATGFQLETPSVNVVDVGTEFAATASQGMRTDVQVYEGAVVTTAKSFGSSGGFPQRLTEGHATRFSPEMSGQAQSIPFSPDRFVRRLPKPAFGGGVDKNAWNKARIHEITITHPARQIVVDGDLSEWSPDGLFRSEHEGTQGKCFVEGRMRYDSTHLYIAAHIGDPAPMRSTIDPSNDGELGWNGGGLQVRLSTNRALGWPVNANSELYYNSRHLTVTPEQLGEATSEHLVHLTMWHYAQSGQNCLHLAYGMDFHDGIVNPAGYEGAFRKDSDGRGYTLEYAIPWTLLHASEAPKAGDNLAAVWNTHWSDETGRLWRFQHVEIYNGAETPGIHTYERAAVWGRALYR